MTEVRSASTTGDAPDPATAMDRRYRLDRHIYDATRWAFLFGRDGLVNRVSLAEGECALEVGCGTGRNLLALARRFPRARLFGLDASRHMLEKARAKVASRGLEGRIALAQGLAEELDPRGVFGLDRPFDAVVFSYSLSMIPAWRGALDAALGSLRDNGCIHIVDYSDQRGWPRVFRGMLSSWLAHCGVVHRPELLERLHELERDGRITLQITTILGRYAYQATAQRAAHRRVAPP